MEIFKSATKILMCCIQITLSLLVSSDYIFTVVPTKSDSDLIFCLQLLSKSLTFTIHLSYRESTDHLCIHPIPWIG